VGVGGVGGANRVGFLLHFLPFHLTLRPHIILAETLLFDHYRKDARLPEQLQRAMAAEAEASREARAKVIAADGEKRASKALREASNVIEQSPSALQLRYLQTLSSIAAEKNSTIVFPVPIDFISQFVQSPTTTSINSSNHPKKGK